MERMKKRISRWLLALLSTVLVLASLVGCGSADVNEALDTAIEVLEIVEALEAEAEVETETGSEAIASDESSILSESTDVSATIAPERRETESMQDQASIDEDGHYTSKEEVALYIHTYGKLPSNFISKDEAEDLGWKKKDGEAGQLHVVAPGMSIGGSYFGNYEGLLPEEKGRKYYECDINYVKGNRGAERIVYSNDGLIFYTGDHYESFEQLYPKE